VCVSECVCEGGRGRGKGSKCPMFGVELMQMREPNFGSIFTIFYALCLFCLWWRKRVQGSPPVGHPHGQGGVLWLLKCVLSGVS